MISWSCQIRLLIDYEAMHDFIEAYAITNRLTAILLHPIFVLIIEKREAENS